MAFCQRGSPNIQPTLNKSERESFSMGGKLLGKKLENIT
ncbi:hypothetical protein MYAER_0723 [Microcystis aeruginosa NIES-2549]|uniref:Uncharacterized protein n=1 Tax=Microcystis aeruginosa NIES-2549 TaxID=1641812 RepID=A0A0F6RK08_MICAE|nr:hypothetical protein MYAER_0723 [Microcystis aeruginosa NIES-2549]AOC51477.1 hypothetical protein amyaer_0728 [Microcystis aeruginosa NIES-2481]